MELDDIDSSNEEREVRIMHLRKSLSQAHDRIKALETVIEELNLRRESLEKGRSDNIYRLAQVVENIETIENSFKAALHGIKDVRSICKDKEQ
jgi:predicted  nucleic acid-binding Zn-ribbon protein